LVDVVEVGAEEAAVEGGVVNGEDGFEETKEAAAQGGAVHKV
jgi:hypothetical protein